MSKTAEVVPARPAATVMLGRDAHGGPEFLLVKRKAVGAFAGAHVFPGGVVDQNDCLDKAPRTDMDWQQACRCLQLTADAGDYYVAALRELFEETGILLANGDLPASTRDRDRAAVHSGAVTFCEVLAREDLTLNCSSLTYFGHWITPDEMPQRFDTRFFLAQLPAGQVASHDGVELTDSCWMTAGEALNAAAEKRITLSYPTREILRDVTALATMDEALQWAAERQRQGVPTIRPTMPRP